MTKSHVSYFLHCVFKHEGEDLFQLIMSEGYLHPWLPQPCVQAKHCGSRVVFGRGSSLLDRNREKETKKEVRAS